MIFYQAVVYPLYYLVLVINENFETHLILYTQRYIN